MVINEACRLSRDVILSLRSTPTQVNSVTRNLLLDLGLGPPRRRGCRSGKRIKSRVPVFVYKQSAASSSLFSSPSNARRHRAGINVICRRIADNVFSVPTIVGRRMSSAKKDCDHDRRQAVRCTVRRAAIPAVFNVGIFNARSVRNKSASIAEWIVSNKLCIAAMSETWHDSYDSPSLIACCPPNFCYVESARTRSEVQSTSMGTNHGGVCLFHHNSFKVSRLSLTSYSTFETICARISGPQLTTVTMAVVYRPGSSATSDLFFDEFADLLERVAVTSSPLIIAGDLNVHMETVDDPAAIKLLDILSMHSLTQRIKGPTHDCGHTLDVLITRSDQIINSINVDPPLLSDHSLIVASVDIHVSRKYNVSRQARRSWRSLDVELFARDLRQSALTLAPPADVDALFQCYNDTLRSLVDVHAPLRMVSCRKGGRSARWYDGDCRVEKAKTRRLERIYRRSLSTEAHMQWRQQFKRLRKLLQRKAAEFWCTAISSCNGDSKSVWTKINALLKPQSSTAVDGITAQDFADHFTRKVDTIRAATAGAPAPVIDTRVATSYLTSFSPVTTEEIRRLLRTVPAKHCALDPAPTWLIKQIAGDISPIISQLCNSSIESCHLPDTQKLAIVHPRLKKPSLDASDLNSYRPISNLSFLSKLMERVVANRYTAHAENNSLFPDRQSAYRRYHSTETVVMSVLNDVIRAADEGKVTCLVLLDLSAAFDTVDHDILLDVLRRRFLVDGAALEWFRSYLRGRTQVFHAGQQESATVSVSCSVPQGSVLGPVEFISYSEDVTAVVDKSGINHHLFADDKQLSTAVAVTDVDVARNEMEKCVGDVQAWCASRRLQLNGGKTEAIWLGTHGRLQQLSCSDLSLTIGTDTIKPSTVVRDLGVLIDAELTLRQHVSRLVSSCFFHLRRLREVRNHVSRQVLKQLVHSFVISRLDYCNGVLAGLPGNLVTKLQRVQNAAARLVLNLKARDHISPALYQLHWLPVRYRIQYKLCMTMHGVYVRRCPKYLDRTVQLAASVTRRQGLRSSASADLRYVVPTTRTKLGERAFSVAGPTAWNSLPADIRRTTDTAAFKRQLKTHYFNRAFNI